MKRVKRLKNPFANTTEQDCVVTLKRSCLEKNQSREETKQRVESRPFRRVESV